MNYTLLGAKLCEYNPPEEIRLTVLNDIWKVELKSLPDGVLFLPVEPKFSVFITGCIKIFALNRVSGGSRCLH